jgi:DNA-nicking Smr family endonuclease
METLDLHGIRHKEALLAIRNFLAKNQAKGSFSVTLITGNSSVLQQRLFKEILEHSPFTYYIPSWNLGQVVVEYMEL